MSIFGKLKDIFYKPALGPNSAAAVVEEPEPEYPSSYDLPIIGEVKLQKYEWYESAAILVPGFEDKMTFILDGYAFDDHPEHWHEAIENFMTHGKGAMEAAEKHLFAYYEDIRKNFGAEYDCGPEISSASKVWGHIRMSDTVRLTRRHYGNNDIYISLECGCSWEEEHGLQIVFHKGTKVNKVGPYDGHVSNADAYGKDDFENIIYRVASTN